ncbi:MULTISPECIES: DUF6227 family protein [Streptomycetaceae]|uniref:Uncharacterized protein n=1 Tax=Streptantibioticus cattleyicolor (strain ATCC 35852 / DSM 46488 / JCM 4925 / NBRC 14057 / NRRL 8057) TaxID=1003195 RepID=F8JYR1_STREN|nr:MULTISPECIES: DUF6227 family protein [Streptomycetaceae]AEW93833.1 hypothetical protein SCATT_14620 [Streptantibioticus cattleyicolor NRRL 8057 = DSM 46488]MYS58517.1 hypothetical protein [Streptomyces sp. SID5468]CCB74180.1 conserved protein of unknown function [Streptantibioticus cattleyicolor NRRL 8057 = DSM 46488]
MDDTREHVERLLDRAHNAFELDDAVVARLRGALMHCVELHSLHRRNGPPYPLGHRTLRHVFLLPDGADLVLWEIEYTTGPGSRTLHEVYADQAQAAEAERRMTAWCGTEPYPRADTDADAALQDLLSGILDDLAIPGRSRSRHTYEHDRSAEHAWRVLRRAENPDRPGARIRRLLRTAVGHETTLVAMRHARDEGPAVEWALYEHAFLLADDSELSLWEVEHFPPDGYPVCEVYLDETTARDSAERRREAL